LYSRGGHANLLRYNITSSDKEFLNICSEIKPKITNYFAEGRTIIMLVSIHSDISCIGHFVTANLLYIVTGKYSKNVG
jgi:hypothetical protein